MDELGTLTAQVLNMDRQLHVRAHSWAPLAMDCEEGVGGVLWVRSSGHGYFAEYAVVERVRERWASTILVANGEPWDDDPWRRPTDARIDWQMGVTASTVHGGIACLGGRVGAGVTGISVETENGERRLSIDGQTGAYLLIVRAGWPPDFTLRWWDGTELVSEFGYSADQG